MWFVKRNFNINNHCQFANSFNITIEHRYTYFVVGKTSYNPGLNKTAVCLIPGTVSHGKMSRKTHRSLPPAHTTTMVKPQVTFPLKFSLAE